MLITSHAFSSSALWTPPAGMTEAVDVHSQGVASATGIGLSVNYELQPAAGAVGVKTATADSFDDTGNAHALALSPGS